MEEVEFYEKRGDGEVQCHLCPRNCVIGEGKRGYCGVRENREGKLYSLVYGKPCTINVDPIEKKPLYHFAPGTNCLSIATVGCNLGCKFCQNWQIAHPERIFGRNVSPEEVVERVKESRVPGIAYTYTEPTIAWEYYLDIMKLARREGLYNVWVSNGYTSLDAIKKMGEYLDAINVDIKGDKEFYRKLCAVPDMSPIFEALKEYKKQGVWIEVTNLIIPGYNDTREKVEELVKWVKENLGTETPIHFSAFFPHYKMKDTPPTGVETLEMAVETAEKMEMKYVYLGNLPSHRKESTYCPKCGAKVIDRSGFSVTSVNWKCPECNEEIALAGKKWF